jgi:hypothetical protein
VSNGRSEKRMRKTVSVEVFLLDDPTFQERTSTDNVSAHGVRVFMQRKLRPKQRAVVISASEGIRSQATVVYCNRTAQNTFAVGLEMAGRVEAWARPY